MLVLYVLNSPIAMENMEKALEMVGKEGYSYLFGNCETFANYCRYGEPVSFQVNVYISLVFS